MVRNIVGCGLSVLGGVAGGVLGFYAVGWIKEQDFYALVLPGGLVGIGCGLVSRHDSTARGAFCGLVALALGLYCDWRYFPFRADRSLGYYLTHISDLPPVTLIMIMVGGVLAFWFGRSQFLLRRKAD
jgi:hypothetical protein